MKIILCCEFFYPSVGGVQEIMKQLALRLVARGHSVTVLTTMLLNKEVTSWDGIEICSFNIQGNRVKGLQGDIEKYHQFLLKNEYDILFIYAGQQWTFDALWPCLPHITAKKIFVPCGFSALFDPLYKAYFSQLPTILKQFDALIFHSYSYRDFYFAQKHHLENCVLIPNGADNNEFGTPPPKTFRASHHIAENEAVIITVGSLNGQKGHLEIAKAFCLLSLKQPVTLLLNGNIALKPKQLPMSQQLSLTRALAGLRLLTKPKKFFSRLTVILKLRPGHVSQLNTLVTAINSGKYGSNKKAIICDLSRTELIRCYFEANLFVFASKIEYSPLVLFEACAAGLPFLSVPVGNAQEIVDWTGGGEICAASLDNQNFTQVAPRVLAEKMQQLLENPRLLASLGQSGRRAWETHFNWDYLIAKYEALFIDLHRGVFNTKPAVYKK